jgi:hypothetical protein
MTGPAGYSLMARVVVVTRPRVVVVSTPAPQACWLVSVIVGVVMVEVCARDRVV